MLKLKKNRTGLLEVAEDWPGQHQFLRDWKTKTNAEKMDFCKRVLKADGYEVGIDFGLEKKELIKSSPRVFYQKIKKVFKK